MRKILVIAVAVVVLGSGAVAQQNVPAQPDRKAQSHQALVAVDAAAAACREKRLRGEIKTFTDSAGCSNAGIWEAWKAINYENMDLVGALIAARTEGAQKLDRGEITEVQYALQMAQEMAILASKELQRRTAQLQAYNAAIAAGAAPEDRSPLPILDEEVTAFPDISDRAKAIAAGKK